MRSWPYWNKPDALSSTTGTVFRRLSCEVRTYRNLRDQWGAFDVQVIDIILLIVLLKNYFFPVFLHHLQGVYQSQINNFSFSYLLQLLHQECIYCYQNWEQICFCNRFSSFESDMRIAVIQRWSGPSLVDIGGQVILKINNCLYVSVPNECSHLTPFSCKQHMCKKVDGAI